MRIKGMRYELASDCDKRGQYWRSNEVIEVVFIDVEVGTELIGVFKVMLGNEVC